MAVYFRISTVEHGAQMMGFQGSGWGRQEGGGGAGWGRVEGGVGEGPTMGRGGRWGDVRE